MFEHFFDLSHLFSTSHTSTIDPWHHVDHSHHHHDHLVTAFYKSNDMDPRCEMSQLYLNYKRMQQVQEDVGHYGSMYQTGVFSPANSKKMHGLIYEMYQQLEALRKKVQAIWDTADPATLKDKLLQCNGDTGMDKKITGNAKDIFEILKSVDKYKFMPNNERHLIKDHARDMLWQANITFGSEPDRGDWSERGFDRKWVSGDRYDARQMMPLSEL
eukprot:gene379-490_t